VLASDASMTQLVHFARTAGNEFDILPITATTAERRLFIIRWMVTRCVHRVSFVKFGANEYVNWDGDVASVTRALP
jgi:hypothetical protein